MKTYLAPVLAAAISSLTLSVSARPGAAPDDPGILFEAEDCKPLDARFWRVLRYKQSDDLPAYPSGGGVLEAASLGVAPASGIASKKPTAGKYRVWARFRIPNDSNVSIAPCSIVVKQKGEPFKSVSFAIPSSDLPADLRAPEDAFVWLPYGVVELAGDEPVTVTFSQERGETPEAVPASIDCVYFSADAARTTPPPADLAPRQLFLRFVVEPDGLPMTLGMGGHSWAWKQRLILPRMGAMAPGRGGKPEARPVEPGQASDWTNLSVASDFTREHSLVSIGAAPVKRADGTGQVAYRLQLATRPDPAAVFMDHLVRGGNPSVVGWFDLAGRSFAADFIVADRTAEKIAALPPARGRRPVKFPVGTAICVEGLADSVVDREMKNVAALGFNSFGLGTGIPFFIANGPKHGYTFLDGQQFRGELSATMVDEKGFKRNDPAASQAKAAAFAKTLRDNQVVVPFCSLADEPSMNFGQLLSDPMLLHDFPGYLAEQGLTAEELGIASLETAKPARYDEAPSAAMHYWSMRYYVKAFGDRFRGSTQAAASQSLRTGVNFACQAVGNILWDGADWFQFYRDGTLTYGWTEDWFNLCNTYQFVSFQMAVMRAACKPAGTPYGTYCVIGNRTPWDVGAKSFSQFARRIDSFKIFNYGPSYGNADNFDNREPELFQEVRDVNFAIGAVEDTYLEAEPLRGDVAMLYSTTSDIWNSWKRDWFPASLPGLERSTLYLLLGQCGVRTDIVYEGDLAQQLKDHRALFAIDSHIHADNLPALIDWVKAGGILYLGANALAYDHYNRPTQIEAKLGIRRGEFKLESAPGGLQGGMPATLGEVAGHGEAIPMIYGVQDVEGEALAARSDGRPALSATRVGKGKVVQCGFFPGLSHFKRASHNRDINFQSLSVYPENTRSMMRAVLEAIEVKPLVQASHPMVEAHLLQASDCDLAVLANWSGEKQSVTIALPNDSKYTRAEAVRAEDAELTNSSDGCSLRLTVGTGDFVRLFR